MRGTGRDSRFVGRIRRHHVMPGGAGGGRPHPRSMVTIIGGHVVIVDSHDAIETTWVSTPVVWEGADT